MFFHSPKHQHKSILYQTVLLGLCFSFLALDAGAHSISWKDNKTTDNTALMAAPFITTWQTTADGESITIPTTGPGYNYTVDWGDGNTDADLTGDATHSYATAGTYTVTISGDFPRIKFGLFEDSEKIFTIEQWGDIAWSSMEDAFYRCDNLTLNATDAPHLSAVTNMSRMFRGAEAFNGDLSSWDVSNVVNMSGMFYESSRGISNFDGDLSNWNVGSVTDMSEMFFGAGKFKSDLSSWDVSSVTDMSEMFRSAVDFNSDLSNWDVSSVTDMSYMFSAAFDFNGDLSTWDVSNVTTMNGMFSGSPFGTNSFSGDLSTWDVSNVTNMNRMFFRAETFNGEVSTWDVSNVTDMEYMFFDAEAFNGDLSTWDVSNVTDMSNMLSGSGLSVESYDQTLIGWASLPSLQNGISLGADNLNYCQAATARQSLIDTYGWTIIDAGQNCVLEFLPFITTWQTTTDGELITIPTIGTGYNYSVDWGDGNTDADLTGDATHSYATAGTYTVTISGDFPRIYFNNTEDGDKILTIEQWGNIAWVSMENAFYGCVKLTLNATDAPDLSAVTDMNGMFFRAYAFTGDLSNWDVSNVTDMGNMFREASAFDGDLSTWDVSSVTNMRYMFSDAETFASDLGNWDVSNVTDMYGMFFDASAFDSDLTTWNVSSITDMGGMFFNADAFNGDLSTWNVSNVTSMINMFANAKTFNGDLSSWDVSNVTNMRGTFSEAVNFNGNLSTWDVSNVTDMREMLDGSGLSLENYDRTLIGWANLSSLQSNVSLGANNLNYCQGADARQSLIDVYGWIITDAGQSCAASPTVIRLSPADEASAIAPSTDLTMTFSENIFIGTGTVTIRRLDDQSTLQTIDVTDASQVAVSGSVVTINPASDLPFQTTLYVEVAATAFQNEAGNAYAGISDLTTWNFTTTTVSPGKQTQEISFEDIEDQKIGQNPIVLEAQGGGSGNPVTYELITEPASGVAYLEGNTLVMEGLGTVTILANQAGNATHEAADEVSITFSIIPNELFLPTLFSPNGDGNNDYFILRGAGGVTRIELSIYNREGEVVYHSTDFKNIAQKGWDGTYRGRALIPGNYVWVVKGNHTDGKPLQVNGTNTGKVRLLR